MNCVSLLESQQNLTPPFFSKGGHAFATQDDVMDETSSGCFDESERTCNSDTYAHWNRRLKEKRGYILSPCGSEAEIPEVRIKYDVNRLRPSVLPRTSVGALHGLPKKLTQKWKGHEFPLNQNQTKTFVSEKCGTEETGNSGTKVSETEKNSEVGSKSRNVLDFSSLKCGRDRPTDDVLYRRSDLTHQDWHTDIGEEDIFLSSKRFYLEVFGSDGEESGAVLISGLLPTVERSFSLSDESQRRCLMQAFAALFVMNGNFLSAITSTDLTAGTNFCLYDIFPKTIFSLHRQALLYATCLNAFGLSSFAYYQVVLYLLETAPIEEAEIWQFKFNSYGLLTRKNSDEKESKYHHSAFNFSFKYTKKSLENVGEIFFVSACLTCYVSFTFFLRINEDESNPRQEEAGFPRFPALPLVQLGALALILSALVYVQIRHLTGIDTARRTLQKHLIQDRTNLRERGLALSRLLYSSNSNFPSRSVACFMESFVNSEKVLFRVCPEQYNLLINSQPSAAHLAPCPYEEVSEPDGLEEDNQREGGDTVVSSLMTRIKQSIQKDRIFWWKRNRFDFFFIDLPLSFCVAWTVCLLCLTLASLMQSCLIWRSQLNYISVYSLFILRINADNTNNFPKPEIPSMEISSAIPMPILCAACYIICQRRSHSSWLIILIFVTNQIFGHTGSSEIPLHVLPVWKGIRASSAGTEWSVAAKKYCFFDENIVLEKEVGPTYFTLAPFMLHCLEQGNRIDLRSKTPDTISEIDFFYGNAVYLLIIDT